MRVGSALAVVVGATVVWTARGADAVWGWGAWTWAMAARKKAAWALRTAGASPAACGVTAGRSGRIALILYG